MIVLKPSTDFVFMAALFGVKAGESVLDRWKTPEGKHKYSLLCPTSADSIAYPCACEADGRAVAMFFGNLLRVDATHPYKDGAGHDLFRKGNKALAFFGSSSPKYSAVGAYMITEFWSKRSNLGPLSGELRCSTPTEVDIVFEKTFKL